MINEITSNGLIIGRYYQLDKGFPWSKYVKLIEIRKSILALVQCGDKEPFEVAINRLTKSTKP